MKEPPVTPIFAGTNEIMKTIAARFMGCKEFFQELCAP